MRPIDPAGFEARYRTTIDPWNYRGSSFEAAKRRVLLRACGARRYASALELGCSIGETSRVIAQRCLHLLAVDSSATAITEAQRSPGERARITFRQAELPRDTPRGPFQLIVIAELAYYLPPRALNILIARMDAALAPGGRLVTLHHLRPFDDAAQSPARSQAQIVSRFASRGRVVFRERRSQYEAVAIEINFGRR